MSDLRVAADPAPGATDERPSAPARPRRVPAPAGALDRGVRRVLGERAWYAVVFVLAAAAGLLWLPAWLQATVDLGLIYAMGAISLNLVTGVAGLPSIGNAAFLAIGAFSVALLAPARNEFWLGLLIGAVVCTAVGALVGLTARRVSGLYLAVSTLALQFLVADGANLWQQHTKHPGGYPVPTPTVLPGVVLTSLRTWYVVLAVALGLVALLASNLLRSRWGRSWLAIRENDVMARSLGIDVARQKLVVFCVSSGILGVAGALLAYFTLVITATTFSLTLAIEFVSMIIIGGLGSVPGSIVGTAIIVAIPQVLQHVGSGTAGSSWWSRNTFNIQTAIFGLIIIAVLVVAPEGLASFGRRLVRGR